MTWIRLTYLLILLLPSAWGEDIRAASRFPLSPAACAVETSDCRSDTNPSLGRGLDDPDHDLLAVRQPSKRSRTENGPTPGEFRLSAPGVDRAPFLSGKLAEVNPSLKPCPDLLYVLMSLQR